MLESMSRKGFPTKSQEVQMYQAPQQSRPARSSLSAATTRVQHLRHSMRAQRSQIRVDEEPAARARPGSDHSASDLKSAAAEALAALEVDSGRQR